MRLTGPTVELVRRTYLPDRPWHLVTGRDEVGRRIVFCQRFLFYNSAEGLRASRADIRHGFVRVCAECRKALEVRDAEDPAGS